MVGRGSRAFGQSKGVYYTYEFGEIKSEISNRLKEKELARGNCYELVKLLYTRWSLISPKEKEMTKAAMENGKWQINNSKFNT